MTPPFEAGEMAGTASSVLADESSVAESLRRVAHELERLERHAAGDLAYRLDSASRAIHLALVQLESASN
jgi:hypothetical protein